jgi:hypothetical protein
MEGRLSHQLSFKTCFVSVDLVPSTPRGERQGLERERERERREKERECGAVGATSTPSTVGLFSFLTMLFLPTFSQ